MAVWNFNNIAIGKISSIVGEDSSDRGKLIVHASHALSKLRVSTILHITKNRQPGYDKVFDIDGTGYIVHDLSG